MSGPFDQPGLVSDSLARRTARLMASGDACLFEFRRRRRTRKSGDRLLMAWSPGKVVAALLNWLVRAEQVGLHDLAQLRGRPKASSRCSAPRRNGGVSTATVPMNNSGFSGSAWQMKLSFPSPPPPRRSPRGRRRRTRRQAGCSHSGHGQPRYSGQSSRSAATCRPRISLVTWIGGLYGRNGKKRRLIRTARR